MSTNKSFSTETSERYSRALFEVAKDTEELEKIETDIKNFQLIISSSLELQNFTQNPTQSISTQNSVIDLISEKLSFTKNTKNFFLLLIKKRRIFFVKKILESFLRLCSNKRGEIKASLISSKELSASELENIREEKKEVLETIKLFECKICMDELNKIMLVPCGHCFCLKCSKNLTECPICRSQIQSINNIYFN